MPPSPNAKNDPPFNWAGFLQLISPSGQQQMIDFVQRAQRERGANWLPEIKAEFPMASWIIELVCTRTAEQALDAGGATSAKRPVRLLGRNAIITLHARLKDEIEKPR